MHASCLCWNLSGPEKVLLVLDPSLWDPIPINFPYFDSNLAFSFSEKVDVDQMEFPQLSFTPCHLSVFFYTFLTFFLTPFQGQPLFLGTHSSPPGPHAFNSAPSSLSYSLSFLDSLAFIPGTTWLSWSLIFTRASHSLRHTFLRRPVSSRYYILHHLSPLAKGHLLLLFSWNCSQVSKDHFPSYQRIYFTTFDIVPLQHVLDG